MNCPRCGAWANVLETRRTQEGHKRRRYECANLHRFNTLEYPVPSKGNDDSQDKPKVRRED